MTDKRLCCFESGHEGGHNFVPGFSAASIPNSCLAEEPVEPHPLEARVRELEAKVNEAQMVAVNYSLKLGTAEAENALLRETLNAIKDSMSLSSTPYFFGFIEQIDAALATKEPA
jgi:hypothetical protein